MPPAVEDLRVDAEAAAEHRDDRLAEDRLDRITRIGADGISHRRGHKYLTLVVDHDSRRLLRIAQGRSKATLAQFFTQLGPERCARIELVCAGGADWIFNAVRDVCPNAEICLDPFHVVGWAGNALDDVRRQVWNAARCGWCDPVSVQEQLSRLGGCTEWRW